MNPEQFLGFVRPKIIQSLGMERLHPLLQEKRILRVKFRTDPTSNQLHMGHVVSMLLLDMFQKAGHSVDFIPHTPMLCIGVVHLQ